MSNLPIPDQLAAVRDEIRKLEERESALRSTLLSDPDTRTGASWIAEIKTTQQERTDLRELRAAHPEIVEQYTHPVPVTRVVLSGVDEHGEIISARKMRQQETEGA